MSSGGDQPSAWRRALTLLVLVMFAWRLAVPAPAISAGALAGDAGLAAVLGEVPICHADASSAPATPAPANRPAIPAHDCALCPVCQLAAAPALIATGARLPEPRAAVSVPTALPPPSTGPPLPARYAAFPRGPPASAI